MGVNAARGFLPFADGVDDFAPAIRAISAGKNVRQVGLAGLRIARHGPVADSTLTPETSWLIQPPCFCWPTALITMSKGSIDSEPAIDLQRVVRARQAQTGDVAVLRRGLRPARGETRNRRRRVSRGRIQKRRRTCPLRRGGK